MKAPFYYFRCASGHYRQVEKTQFDPYRKVQDPIIRKGIYTCPCGAEIEEISEDAFTEYLFSISNRHIIPSTHVPNGSLCIVGTDYYVNAEEYEEMKGHSAKDMLIAIGRLKQIRYTLDPSLFSLTLHYK